MKDKKPNNEKRDKIELSLSLNKRLLKYVVIILALIFSFYVIVAMPEKIGAAISFILNLLSPFLIGFCIAFVVNLLLRPLERFWLWIWRKAKKKNLITKLKRPVSLTLGILIVLGVVFAIVFMIIPALKSTIVSFAEKVPQYAKTVESWSHSVVEFLARYNVTVPEISLNITQLTQIFKGIISNYGSNVLDTTVNVTATIVSAVVNIALGFVFAIYLLAQKEKLGNQAQKVVKAILNPERSQKLLDVTALTNSVFTKFITGQFADACILGVLCFIGMLIFRMPYAAIISVLIAFTALIPIFGAFIGAGIGVFLILLESPVKAFWFIVFIIVLQQLEGNLIYPRVVGKSVGLPGIWVLVAVTIGGSLFGVLGMLFSVPICTVLYVLFREFVNNRTRANQLEKDVTEVTE